MEDETTRQLPAIEARIMAVITEMRTEIRERLTAIEGEVAVTRQAFHTRSTALEEKIEALEEKVDSRLRETQPIWEGIKVQLDRVESKLDVFATDTSALLLETRTDLSQVRKRVSQLEARER